MKIIEWIKEKFNPQQAQQPSSTDDSLITLTNVEPSNKQPAPVIESEILAESKLLAEQPIYKTSPQLAIAPQPETTCFPELAVLLKGQRVFPNKIKQIMCENKSYEYTPTTVGTQLMTEIGEWLQGEGKQLEAFPEYHNVVKAHTQFNRCAGKILVHHQRGAFLDAMWMLKTDLIQHSALVEESLQALLIRARHDCCPECAAHNDELIAQVAA